MYDSSIEAAYESSLELLPDRLDPMSTDVHTPARCAHYPTETADPTESAYTNDPTEGADGAECALADLLLRPTLAAQLRELTRHRVFHQ